MARLEGKVAIITGAARGIGAAIAQAFVHEGAVVLVTDFDNTAGAITVAELGGKASYLRLDVREEADWVRVMNVALEAHKQLDILVNNAGVTGFEAGPVVHDPENADLEDWRAVHRTNLDGVFLGCKHAIRTMRPQKRGSIINISSRSGMVGIPGAAAYASSKAAVRNHTKSVALHCAQAGLAIRRNSIHPAAVLTPMWEPMLGAGPERNKRMRQFVSDTPLRRFGTPDEVAAIAVLLASDEATYMTGSEITIDGGIMAGSAAAPEDMD